MLVTVDAPKIAQVLAPAGIVTGGAVTVSTAVLLVTVSNVAVTFVVPAAMAVANPPDTMVATDVFEECHITDAVISCVGPDEYVPIAVYCCVKPAAIVAVLGVTVIEFKVAAITVKVSIELVTEPSVAAITVNTAVLLVTLLNVAVILLVPAADVILQYAQNEKINLILLGSRAIQEGGRYKTGSTIENVARYAKQSVFICKNNTVSKILCGIDGSEASAAALHFAVDLARRFSASCSLLVVR